MPASHFTMAINGFVKCVRTGDHATLWVEGWDGVEPSVAGVALTRDQLDELIARLARVRNGWPK